MQPAETKKPLQTSPIPKEPAQTTGNQEHYSHVFHTTKKKVAAE